MAVVNLATDAARRILVVTKFRYLGDTIIATPFLRRLREARPDADISLLAGPAVPELLHGCPYIADFIPFSAGDARRLAPTLALVRRLREKRFDIVFLLNRSLHSALVARLAR